MNAIDSGVDVQEGDPGDGLEDGFEEAALTETILHDAEGKRAETGEDDETSKPDLERMHVEAVDVRSPPKNEVVENGKHEARSDADCSTLALK